MRKRHIQQRLNQLEKQIISLDKEITNLEDGVYEEASQLEMSNLERDISRCDYFRNVERNLQDARHYLIEAVESVMRAKES